MVGRLGRHPSIGICVGSSSAVLPEYDDAKTSGHPPGSREQDRGGGSYGREAGFLVAASRRGSAQVGRPQPLAADRLTRAKVDATPDRRSDCMKPERFNAALFALPNDGGLGVAILNASPTQACYEGPGPELLRRERATQGRSPTSNDQSSCIGPDLICRKVWGRRR